MTLRWCLFCLYCETQFETWMVRGLKRGISPPGRYTVCKKLTIVERKPTLVEFDELRVYRSVGKCQQLEN